MGCIQCQNRSQKSSIIHSHKDNQESSKRDERRFKQSIIDKKIKLSSNLFVEENHKKFESFYTIIEELGEGAFGKVFKATHKINNGIFAVKSIVKNKINLSQEDEAELIREIEILKVLDHPNIIKVYEYFNSPGHFNIILEYCNGGELFDEIVKVNHFSEEKAACIMKQLLSAITFCHSKSIIHRDLKPENILIQKSTLSNANTNKSEIASSSSIAKDNYNQISVKIIDFGTSCIKKEGHLKEKTGTAYYIAPEVIKHNYNEKCDVWSLGVILFIMLSGSPPFSDEDDDIILKKIEKGKYEMTSPIWKEISEEAKNLITQLLTYEYQKRPSASFILENDVWLKSNCEKTNKAIARDNQSCSLSAFKNISKYKHSKKLQQVVIGFVLHHLSNNEDIERLRKLFMIIDTNGDGQLTRDELFNGLKLEVGESKAKSEIDLIMASLDNDFSGFIEFQEFLRASIDKNKILTDTNLIQAFKLFDNDGSGVITYDEVKRVLGRGGENLDDNIWKEMVNEVDVNKRGGIDLDNFKAMMLEVSKEN